MPIFHYTIRGALVAPEGSKLVGNAVVLPDGSTLKAWETFEYTREAEGETTDMGLVELEKIGCFFDGDSAEMEEFEDRCQIWPPPA